jgi:hypothetical protein
MNEHKFEREKTLNKFILLSCLVLKYLIVKILLNDITTLPLSKGSKGFNFVITSFRHENPKSKYSEKNEITK